MYFYWTADFPQPQRLEAGDGGELLQASSGERHSLLLFSNRRVYSCGDNSLGQLGQKREQSSERPEPIQALASLPVDLVSCGKEHSMAVCHKGRVFAWGAGSKGQLGIGEFKEINLIPMIALITKVLSGSIYHTIAYVNTTGQVVSLGCGPSPTSNPTHQEVPAENSDITCLLSTEDLKDVQVKDIFAGAYANFVTTHQHDRSTSVSMKILPEINRINQSLAKKWIATKKNNKCGETKREIKVIFSSAACLTASFLKERDTGEKNFIDVDLKMARNVFKKLTTVKWISSMITTCLEDNLLKALPYRSRHQDALLIFLLIPECLMMQDPKKRKTLTVEFAKAIYEMNGESLAFLKKCWKSLEVSSLNTLVQMLKDAIITIISQLCNPVSSTEHQCDLKVLLEVMKHVHKANCQLPESTFIINEFSAILNGQLPSKCPDLVFSDFLFSFDLSSKVKLMLYDSLAKLYNARESQGSLIPSFLTLKVRRSHLVEDTMRQLGQAESFDLRKPLTVEFIKEIRAESGGVSSEFFHCIFQEMTDPKYEMFVYPEKNSNMWFPVNPNIEKKNYFLFGILCGLALSNVKAVNLPFPLALYKKLLGKKPSLEDLKELSFPVGKSLQEILNCEADDIEELHIPFSIHWDQKDVKLITDAISVPVNQTNKKDYVSKCVDYIFNTSVKKIYEEFHRGFYKVCNWDIIRQFQPEELMTAIIGNTTYDWKQFENNSKYEKEYHESHPTIIFFWKAFHELTLDDKKKFLLFLTGSDRLHVKGLQYDGIIFRCPQTLSEKDNPRSLTCHNILDLPKYSTLKRMKEALQVAISNNKGFVSW
ncbi:hypothetical protein STEG23_015480 [Scotinomys teguina]